MKDLLKKILTELDNIKLKDLEDNEIIELLNKLQFKIIDLSRIATKLAFRRRYDKTQTI